MARSDTTTPFSSHAQPRAVAAAALAAIPLAVTLAAAFEALRVPASVYGHAPTRVLALLSLAISYALVCAVAPILGQVATAWLLARAAHGALNPRRRRLVATAIAAASAGTSYAVLVRESAFVGYAPLLALHLEVFVVLAIAIAWLAGYVAVDGATHARRRRVVAFVCVTGFAVASWANYVYYIDAYPSLHLSLWQLAFALLQTGVTALLLGRRMQPRAHRLVARALAPVLALCVLASAAGAADTSRRFLWGHTVLGRSRVLWLQWPAPLAAGPPPTTSGGVERFLAQSGMPPLPSDFSLLGHNVLLIASESMRFDQTSFADARMATTPSLLRWQRERNAFAFRRAYAASSTTLQSLASLFTMTFPSAAHWQGWQRPWHGELLPDNATVAEHFSAAGYATFWIGHNYLDLFDKGVLGFEQGFATRQLSRCDHDAASTDAEIAEHTVEFLERAAHTEQKFFGWVFFVSPHLHHVAHDADAPAKTERDLYRQELAYTDAQIGKILHALDTSGLAERTIVVFLADHGEELREHGALGHSRTLHAESVHVPWVVSIPGVPGHFVDAPVSTTYLFPWLFLHGDTGMRSAALARLNGELGAMLEATDDAVVLELLGRERMRSSLVYRDFAIHYDFISDLHELYSVVQDPLEQHDLFESQADVGRKFAGRMQRYRDLRARSARFSIGPLRGAMAADVGADPP